MFGPATSGTGVAARSAGDRKDRLDPRSIEVAIPVPGAVGDRSGREGERALLVHRVAVVVRSWIGIVDLDSGADVTAAKLRTGSRCGERSSLDRGVSEGDMEFLRHR